MGLETHAICQVVERAAMLVDVDKLCRWKVLKWGAIIIYHQGRARLACTAFCE